MSSSKRLMYIQFTPCIYGDAKVSYSSDNKNGVSDSIQVPLFSTANKIDAMYLTNNYLRLWHRCRSDVSIVNFEQVNVSWEASSKCPIKYLQPIHFKCTFLETYRKLFHSAKCLNFVSIFPFIYLSVDLLRKRRTLWPQLETYFHRNCSFYYSKFRFMAVKGSSLTFKILKLKMSVRWTKHIISIFRFRFHRQLSRVILRYC